MHVGHIVRSWLPVCRGRTSSWRWLRLSTFAAHRWWIFGRKQRGIFFSMRWEWFHSPTKRYCCLCNHKLHLKANRVHSGWTDWSWDFYLGQLIMLFAFHEKVSFCVSFSSPLIQYKTQHGDIVCVCFRLMFDLMRELTHWGLYHIKK